MSNVEEKARKVDDNGLDVLFREARTHRAWLGKPISDELLRDVYELFKFGATSSNTLPCRIVFLKTDEAKARLLPLLAEFNVEKSRTAAVVALVAYDLEFYEFLPRLTPHNPALRDVFASNPALIQETAFRNGSLQGAYMMLAARALGLDCGPMSGFDADGVNAEFFPDGKWKVNFVCNLGYGDDSKLHPRAPRLQFEEACKVL